MHEGSDIKIQRFFYYVMKYISPAVLFIIMIWWFINDAFPILMNVSAQNIPFIWASRGLMVLLFVAILLLINEAWEKHSMKKEIQFEPKAGK